MAIIEKAFAGYWFYGASTDSERAALYASYGLLDDAPEQAVQNAIDRSGEGPYFEGPFFEGPEVEHEK